MARALHGPVQATIHSSVQRLRTAVGSGTATSGTVDAVLADIRRTLPGTVLEGSVRGDIAADLAGLVTMWKPLVMIDVVAADSDVARLNTDLVCSEIAGDIVGEAVSNAVRHGEASRLQITLEFMSERVLAIQVVDNGSGWQPRPKVRDEAPGVGTAQLDKCALEWHFEPSSAGNRLWVELPFHHSGER